MMVNFKNAVSDTKCLTEHWQSDSIDQEDMKHNLLDIVGGDGDDQPVRFESKEDEILRASGHGDCAEEDE